MSQKRIIQLKKAFSRERKKKGQFFQLQEVPFQMLKKESSFFAKADKPPMLIWGYFNPQNTL
jgi:hypothetical protein